MLRGFVGCGEVEFGVVLHLKEKEKGRKKANWGSRKVEEKVGENAKKEEVP